jgi:hypothetical protein
MIPGYRDSERIVGRVVRLAGYDTKVLICQPCFVDFALPCEAQDAPIYASDPLAAEQCHVCRDVIRTAANEPGPCEQGARDAGEGVLRAFDWALRQIDNRWPERPHDTALMGNKR